MATNYFPVVHECQMLTSVITKDVPFTWDGDLLNAVLSGTLVFDAIGPGGIQGVIRVNGIEVYRQDPSGGPFHGVCAVNIDVKNWVRQGPNQFQMEIATTWGAVGVANFCPGLDLTVTATGEVQPPEPEPTPESNLAVLLIAAAILIVAVVAVIGKVLR